MVERRNLFEEEKVAVNIKRHNDLMKFLTIPKETEDTFKNAIMTLKKEDFAK